MLDYEKDFYVHYRLPGTDKLRSAGPYLSLHEAKTHRDDIAGYEGIHSVSIQRDEVVDADQ